MSDKSREEAIVIRQEEIADGVFSMWLKTDEIAKNAKAGQFISVYCKDGSRMLPRPLGNGFPKKSKKAILIGGGIGIPPMLELAKELECEKQIVLGYRDELFLTEEFEKAGEIYLATEDGSMGTKGTVLDAIRVNELKADIIYACGPTPMLKEEKEYAKEAGIESWISMEERMA